MATAVPCLRPQRVAFTNAAAVASRAGKSGIVTVAPGKGALGTFAPPLDDAGNSVKGRLVAGFLARRLGMDVFASKPSA